jgi:hypothetical protein
VRFGTAVAARSDELDPRIHSRDISFAHVVNNLIHEIANRTSEVARKNAW